VDIGCSDPEIRGGPRDNTLLSDSLAFTIFVAIFCGGLAAVTVTMVWIAAVLLRTHRKKL
jgi:hypothetical protein